MDALRDIAAGRRRLRAQSSLSAVREANGHRRCRPDSGRRFNGLLTFREFIAPATEWFGIAGTYPHLLIK